MASQLNPTEFRTLQSKLVIFLALFAEVRSAEEGQKVKFCLPHGTITKAAQHFKVDRKTVQQIWKVAQANYARTGVLAWNRKEGDRHFKWNKEWLENSIRNLEFHQRETISGMARAIGIPVSTLSYLIKHKGFLQKHSN